MSGFPNNDPATSPTPTRTRRRRALFAVGIAATIPIVWVLLQTVDGAALATAWRAMLAHPWALVVTLAAFATAFVLRSIAWRRVLTDLPFGHGLAAIHLALGGNHVLPMRLGEPLRVWSVVRRAGVGLERATASTLTLRAGDIAAVAGLGALTGIGTQGGGAALWTAAVVAAVAAAAGAVWLLKLRSAGELSLPGPVALAATVTAWLAESVVVWQAAAWSGINLSPSEAVMVTAAAVVAQVAAVAPGGLGTYEAGGTAALVWLGIDPSTALVTVLTAHAVKTAYSLVTGAVAVFLPAPSIAGRLRLTRSRRSLPPDPAPPAEGPVVLFMPAHNEAESVGAVVARTPTRVGDHDVICMVIDDGSDDATAELAASAGARVIRMGRNRGLGAAVRRGLHEAMALDPVAVAFCDADGEYAPEELANMVEPIVANRADYVVGSRFSGEIERMLPHRRFGNRVLTVALSWLAQRRISDGQSGYRAFSPRAAAAAEIIHDFNYAQVLTLDLLAKGMRYHEVPISYSFRTSGESFIRLGRYLRAVTPAIYKELQSSTT